MHLAPRRTHRELTPIHANRTSCGIPVFALVRVNSRLNTFLQVALILLAAVTVSFAGSPRIVSLSPNLTELVFDMGLGDCLAGRSSACDYPPEALAVPVVGDFGRPNWELLRRMKPDVVIATDLERPAMLKSLEASGIRVLVLPCEGWDGLLRAAREIGVASGRAEACEAWAERMTARRAGIEARVRAFYENRKRPRVYVEVWGDPLTTPVGGTFLDDIVTLAGGDNIAASLKGKYAHVSAEWVMRQDPDVIVLAYMLGVSDAGAALRRRVGWGALRAVREGAICADTNPDLLLRPGPRILDGAEALAEWLMKR